MRRKIDHIDILMGCETNEIIEQLFECLLENYQKDLEEPMRRSDSVFHSIDLLYYHSNKISLNRTWRSMNEWLKKATINPKNNDNNCFQYALTVALKYQNTKKDPQGISKLKPFINHYDWKEIEFPSHTQKDWKKFELNNKSITLNIFFVSYNTEEIRLAYKLKYNFKPEDQVILLMITDGKKMALPYCKQFICVT